MTSLIFAVNAVAPIILTVAVGYGLKRAGLFNAALSKSLNKLVFRVFLPSMLFLNIYKTNSSTALSLHYVLYCLLVLLAVFLLSIPLVIAVARKPSQRGVLLQGTFRSNYALIGIPLAESLFGSDGVLVATLLSAVTIPVFNILAVISLSLFRGDSGRRPSAGQILKDIVKNPLIQGIAAGVAVWGIRLLLEAHGIAFRLSDITPLYTVLTYLSQLATPLALLVLGAQFEFSAVKELRREILFGTLMRTVVVPLFGVGIAYIFFSSQFGGAHFAAFVAMFATPVAVSSVPMTQEMGGDTALAGQLVVWTTLASALSVFGIAFFLKAAGVF